MTQKQHELVKRLDPILAQAALLMTEVEKRHFVQLVRNYVRVLIREPQRDLAPGIFYQLNKIAGWLSDKSYTGSPNADAYERQSYELTLLLYELDDGGVLQLHLWDFNRHPRK